MSWESLFPTAEWASERHPDLWFGQDGCWIKVQLKDAAKYSDQPGEVGSSVSALGGHWKKCLGRVQRETITGPNTWDVLGKEDVTAVPGSRPVTGTAGCFECWGLGQCCREGREKPRQRQAVRGVGLDQDVHPCRGQAWGSWAGEEDCGKEPRRPFLFHRDKKGRDVEDRVRLCFTGKSYTPRSSRNGSRAQLRIGGWY